MYLPNIERKEDGSVGLVERITSPEELLIKNRSAFYAAASKLFDTNIPGLIAFIETIEEGIIEAPMQELKDLGWDMLPDVYKQSTDVLENDLISVMSDIIKHPDNFAQLIAPVGSFDLAKESKKIHDRQLEAKISGVREEYGLSGTLSQKLNIQNLIETTYQMYQTIGGTGIVAKSVTHHGKSQRAGLEFSENIPVINKDGQAMNVMSGLRFNFEGFGSNVPISLDEFRTLQGRSSQ